MATESEPQFISKYSNKLKPNGSLGSLEAMRAQSPPRVDGIDNDVSLYGEDAMQAQYRAWRTSHPSALESFEKLMELAEGKKVAVFLDYDGTLSPIVEDPDKAFMSETVFDFVQLAELYYAGSHGMDIMGPRAGSNGFRANGTASTNNKGNDVVLFQPASEFVLIMDEVHSRLAESTKVVEGAWVENNKFCVSVHFRRVKEEKWAQLAEIVRGVVEKYPKLHTTHGRKVLEVRPTVDWDKGKALAYLLKALELEDVEEVLPVYIGDDRTDEDAFSVLKERGMGAGIVVTTVAKSTVASYSLRDPSEVMDFLQRLVKWRDAQIDSRNGL
eukprot:jgi/Mesen1/2924/ME000175S02079